MNNNVSFSEYQNIVAHAAKNAVLIANGVEALKYKDLFMSAPPSAITEPKQARKAGKPSVKNASSKKSTASKSNKVSCSAAIFKALAKAKAPVSNSDLQDRLAKAGFEFTPTNISVSLLTLSDNGKLVRTGEKGSYAYALPVVEVVAPPAPDAQS